MIEVSVDGEVSDLRGSDNGIDHWEGYRRVAYVAERRPFSVLYLHCLEEWHSLEYISKKLAYLCVRAMYGCPWFVFPPILVP